MAITAAKLMQQYQKPLMIGAGVGVLLAVLYVANRGVKGAASDIAGGIVGGAIDAATGAVSGAYNALPEAVQPSSSNNVINKAFNKQWELWTGSPTFGGWIYDVTH